MLFTNICDWRNFSAAGSLPACGTDVPLSEFCAAAAEAIDALLDIGFGFRLVFGGLGIKVIKSRFKFHWVVERSF